MIFKEVKMPKQFKKDVESIISSAAVLGSGAALIEATGQPQIIPNTIGRAGSFMGPLVAATGAGAVMRQLRKHTKKKRRR